MIADPPPRYALLSIADDGTTVARWAPDPAEGSPLGGAALAEHRGRTFMIYVVVLGENRGQVRVRELGCLPP